MMQVYPKRCGRSLVGTAMVATLAACLAGAGSPDDPVPGKDQKQSPAPDLNERVSAHVLEFTMNRLDGKPEDLRIYEGRVVLLVNVASECGLTPQYAGLEKLYTEKKDNGFVVLGFPANDFGKQEPGTNAEIAEFCSKTYGVSFPMFEKIAVKGDSTHPLYKRLAAQPAPIGGEPKWNFTKFLVDRQGNVVARFEPKVKPDDPALTRKIDDLLAAKPKDK